MSQTYVAIDTQPITLRDGLPISLERGQNGALVHFEGRIRKTHDGKVVSKLFYECYRPLAMKEMDRILSEANALFGLNQSFLIHRIGELSVGDTAVWVGVASPHRKEAFAGCSYVMDQLKERVPIWKKEIYVDGSLTWPGWHTPSHGLENSLHSP
ncbi:MAG: molybdenum cofactor biosynthesis protein MoaE [Oligoflexus sp.]